MQINFKTHFHLNYKKEYKEFPSGPVALGSVVYIAGGPGSIPG